MERQSSLIKLYGAAYHFAFISRNRMDIAVNLKVSIDTVRRWSKQPEWEQALNVWGYTGERVFIVGSIRDREKKSSAFSIAQSLYMKEMKKGTPIHKISAIVAKQTYLTYATINRWSKKYNWSGGDKSESIKTCSD